MKNNMTGIAILVVCVTLFGCATKATKSNGSSPTAKTGYAAPWTGTEDASYDALFTAYLYQKLKVYKFPEKDALEEYINSDVEMYREWKRRTGTGHAVDIFMAEVSAKLNRRLNAYDPNKLYQYGSRATADSYSSSMGSFVFAPARSKHRYSTSVDTMTAFVNKQRLPEKIYLETQIKLRWPNASLAMSPGDAAAYMRSVGATGTDIPFKFITNYTIGDCTSKRESGAYRGVIIECEGIIVNAYVYPPVKDIYSDMRPMGVLKTL